MRGRRSPVHGRREGRAEAVDNPVESEVGEKLLADDLDGDRELDVAVQLGDDGVRAQRLDRFHVQLLAIEHDLGLLLDGVSDVGDGDRAEQLAFGPGLRGDGDDLRRPASVAMVCELSRSCASRRSRDRRIDAAW